MYSLLLLAGAAAAARPTGPRQKALLQRDLSVSVNSEETRLATFGAGCFWGVELAFARLPGVVHTDVGYAGGSVQEPTYRIVSSGRSGHAEVVRVGYDPSQITFQQLLDVFFDIHDPTTLNRQACL